MWNVLDRFAEQIRLYSTPVGQLWNTITFVFRLFVIVAVGSSVYGDEQGAFKCDTGQPGCQNVCFNRFSPISHMRFWAFQILFVSTPAMFFYMYAGTQTGRVKKLEQEKKTLKTKIEEVEEAEKKLMEADDDDDDDGRKSYVAMSTRDRKSHEVFEQEKLVEKLQKKVGRYKEKQVNEMIKGGALTQVIFTTRVRVMYIVHCVIKLGLECLFLYLAYHLQHFQSKVWGWQCWTVPEKYVCTHALDYGAAGSACAQQEKVTCWVSRPYEKQIFLYYMTLMTSISIILIIAEALYMIFRVGRKGLQRRAMTKINNQSGFDSMSMYQNGFDNTMMTMKSAAGIKRGLAASNQYRWSTMQSRKSLPQYNYQFAGQPIIEDFLPDDGHFPPRKSSNKSMNGYLPNGRHSNGAPPNGMANGHAPAAAAAGSEKPSNTALPKE